jgi:hypothetical protein
MYIGQIFTLGLNVMNLRSFLGTFIRFLFPLLVIKIVNKNFITTFPRVVYVLALVSLLFWIGENFIPKLTAIIQHISIKYKLDVESEENILIYNSEGTRFYGIIKNAGFAYEGGAYSIVLIIALILNLINNGLKLDKKNIVFVSSVLSTLSTAGIFSLTIVFYGYLFNNVKNKFKLIILIVGFTFLFIRAYISLDFMQVKIQSQMELTKDPDETRGRFASAMADIRTWQTNPIFGVGKFPETRYSTFQTDSSQHRVNGLAAFLAMFGIVVFSAYLVLIYDSLRQLNKRYNSKSIIVFFQFLSLVVLAFAQICMQWPVFIILLYLPYIAFSKKVNEQKISNSLS